LRLSVLDLAHGPAVIAFDDALESVQVVVEGEPQVTDPAIRQGHFGFRQDIQLARRVPALLPQTVKQVKVDVTSLTRSR
jgi:hypothetical protein